MAYNKNFDKCEMAEYLIINAKEYVSNGNKIRLREFISEFKFPDFNTVLDVDRFITSNQRFNVTINGVTYNDVLPYYVMFIEQGSGFPGDGFYDAFKTQNYEVYNQVASDNIPSNNLTNQQMQDIVDIAKDALNQHINLNFQTNNDINMFITEMINEGKCHKENLF